MPHVQGAFIINLGKLLLLSYLILTVTIHTSMTIHNSITISITIYLPNALLGDLMRRWTNDEWLSTLHRVVIPDR